MEIAATTIIILLFLFISSKVFSSKLLSHVTYDCYFSADEAFEDDEIEFTEEISNNKVLPVPWLKTEFSMPRWLEFPQQQSCITKDSRIVTSFFSVRGMCKIKRVWKVKCLRRGNFSIGNIHIVASDILGHSVISASPDMSKMKKLSVRVLPLADEYDRQINDISLMTGETIVRNKILKDEFFTNGIREYVPGDRIASVNWYATARERSLMVNKYDCTSSCSLTLIMNMQTSQFDVFESVHLDKLENCIKTCASIINTKTSEGLTVRYMANTLIGNEAVDISSSDALPLLETLADITNIVSRAFPDFLQSALPFLRDSYVIVVSPYSSKELLELTYGDPSVILIVPEQTGGTL